MTGVGSPRVLAIAGTRPEAIKIAPVAIEARRRGHPFALLATGQQPARFDAALAEFELRPQLRLPRLPRLPYAPHPDAMVARWVEALLPVLERHAPDMVLVQGDTGSALAGAVAAQRLGIPIAHVEAGLRSGDLASPWPEERNRIAIDAAATLLFAPTKRAAAALAGEPAVRGTVMVTGNTGIDALLWMRDRAPSQAGGPFDVLLTCHRRESFGAGIDAICDAVLALAARGDVRILCPLHDNPAAGEAVRRRLGGHPAITLAPPLSYRALVAAMAGARLILTDSGGIQEEAPALGVPTLVLRDVTERPEGVASGNLRLVGTEIARIVAEAARLLDDPVAHAAMARPAFPFGRGDAAARIVDGLQQYFSVGRSNDRILPCARDEAMTAARAGV